MSWTRCGRSSRRAARSRTTTGCATRRCPTTRSDDPIADEEFLDVGPRRYPRWLVAIGVVVLALVAVWALAHVGKDESTSPGAAATSPGASASAPTPLAVGPFDAAGSMRDQLLSYVFERAHDP